MEIYSSFTSNEFVSTFRRVIKVSSSNKENRVMVDPVAEGEYVTTVNNQEPHYFYMYTHVLQTLNLWLPFTAFESQILRVMNVDPCQLHPNSWAFMKAFEIVCEYLEIVPTAGIFSCFFQVKNVFPHSLISISRQTNRGDSLCLHPTSKIIGIPLFVFAVGKDVQSSCLTSLGSPCSLFTSLQPLDSSGELGWRPLMTSMSTLSAKDRAALVLKAREQKAQATAATASADAMAQLLVDESGTQGSIRVGVLEEQLRRKRMPRSRGLPPTFLGGSSQSHADPGGVPKIPLPPLLAAALTLKRRRRKGPRTLAFGPRILTPCPMLMKELETIDARNKMKVADESLSSLEEEYAASGDKIEGDIKENEWAKERKNHVDELTTLRERAKTLEEQLTSVTKERYEAIS
ncbi:hypothetical protein TSUD_146230 [Trifolium subterraneum]|uniref:Transposase (putative) gypsy type domain-containing protein n=1 Tax=Trifolium subterraneum TaxID=3900 RepID=A0A2Z6MGE5_TRISU|nr:hypothetical protein TSUD_146230 [Trifolium subterraneum]